MKINLVTGTLIKVKLVLVTGTAHWRITDDAGLNYIHASSNSHSVELKIARGTVDDVRMKGIVTRHSVDQHKFADDLQIYIYIPGDLERVFERLSDCTGEVKCWMIKHKLKLNESKTELMVAFSSHNLKKCGVPENLVVGGVKVEPVVCVRNLGAYCDIHMSMKQHVDAVCRKCNYRMRRIRLFRTYTT